MRHLETGQHDQSSYIQGAGQLDSKNCHHTSAHTVYRLTIFYSSYCIPGSFSTTKLSYVDADAYGFFIHCSFHPVQWRLFVCFAHLLIKVEQHLAPICCTILMLLHVHPVIKLLR